MSNPELFLIKDDKEDFTNFEIVKRPTLMFQSESIESLSTSSESSQDKREESNTKEIEECHQSRIVSKQADSESSIPSSGKKLKVEDEEDGFKTPTSLDHRIPVATQCPPAPRKTKPSLKRKASYNHCNCRHPLDLSKEVELLFPTQHIPLSDHSRLSTKKVRREEPK